MEKEVLEVVLKRCARESNIQRILEVQPISELPSGENYSSTIIKIMMKVVLGNGRVVKRSLVIKRGSTGKGVTKVAKDYNIFQVEARMYLVIFKEMGYLMEEFEDYDEPFWCKFLFYDSKDSTLVMEDLSASGFRLVQRQVGLDLEHSLLVLRSLGRYHGMTKILEERGIISKDDYKPFLLADDYYIKIFFHSGIKGAAEGIRKYWGSEWAGIAEKLSVPFDQFLEKIKHFAKQDEGIFTCLNHGDCWSNNMLFRYDWQNRPVSVKFLDYQIPHMNTPCYDISNFIYMSIQPKVRRQNYRLLLEVYHGSLVRTLDKYGYKGPKPSLKEIEKIMKRLSFFGLSYFTAFYAVVMYKSTSAFDMEKVFETDGDEGFNLDIYKEDGMIERLGEDLIDYAEKISAPLSIS